MQIILKSPDEVRASILGNQALLDVIKESMPPAQFIESAVLLFKNPAIAACTPESVFGCLLNAAVFGFRLSPELGLCWVVPRSMVLKGADGKDLLDAQGKKQFQKVATFQVSYKGFMELSFRSGAVESFDYGVVRERDRFEYQKGTAGFLNHTPSPLATAGRRTFVWAGATMVSGRFVFNVADVDTVEKHRLMSDSQVTWENNRKVLSKEPISIWRDHYDAMAMRVPMRDLCTKQLPKTPGILRATELDGAITLVTKDGVVTTPPSEVFTEAERAITEGGDLVLSLDYLDEISACQSVDSLKEVWERQRRNMPEALQAAFDTAVINRKRELSNPA